MRRSSRHAAAAAEEEEEEDQGGGDEKAAVEDAVRVAKSLFPWCPADAVQVYNVEGRGSCGPFGLAVAMGLKLGHAAPTGGELTAKVGKVTAKDRHIDLQLRKGAHEIVHEHYEGGKGGVGFVRAANCFSPDLVHKVAKMTTEKNGGEWVSIEWLGFMAAFAGLRYLYVINVDNKVIFVTRIDYDADNKTDIMRLEHHGFTFAEWSGAASFSQHAGKTKFKRMLDDDAAAEGEDLPQTFAVLISSGTSGESMHYVAVRPSDDGLAPFLQTLDENPRGQLLVEEFRKAQNALPAKLGEKIGRYVAEQRKRVEAAPELRWCDIPVRASGGSGEGATASDDYEDAEANREAVAGGSKSSNDAGGKAGRSKSESGDDEEEAEAGGKAGESESGDDDEKAEARESKGVKNRKKAGDGLTDKPVVFHTRVFATRVDHKDLVDKAGAEVVDKLNMEIHPDYKAAPYSATLFCDLPKLAQLAAESLGWTESTWDADSFTPKLDYSSTGTVVMSAEMRELIQKLHPNLKKDEERLSHSYLIKRVLGYSPWTWPGPQDKFGEFEEDIELICEVLERVWLLAATESSAMLPGLTEENEDEDKLALGALDDDGRRLYFLDHFYSEIVDKILFKGARRRALRLSPENEELIRNWARDLIVIVVKEVQEAHHGEEQEVDAEEEADLTRLVGDSNLPLGSGVREATTKKGKKVERYGHRHRHVEQHTAIKTIVRDQKEIVSLMFLDEDYYVVWMVGGAMFKVPSSQINVIFTKLFRNKLRLNPNKKFKVPIGHRSKSMTKLPTSFAALPTSLVSTKTSKMCVGLAIALGMHAVGDFQNMPLVKQHAGLAVHAVEAGRFSDELDYFRSFFQTQFPRLYSIELRGVLTCDALLILARGSPQKIFIINPVGTDGNCGHALCVYENFIYDSAEERVMPLEQQWLDRCVCVDARDMATCGFVRKVLILQPSPRLLKGVKRSLDKSDNHDKRAKI